MTAQDQDDAADQGSHTEKTDTARVWDPIVRIGHWVLVIGVFAAYFTGDEVPTVHVWAGYAVAVTVVIRVLWGLVGTRHARFSSFVRGPGRVWAYVRGLATGEAKRSVGHNPAGAAMTLALLLALTGTTGTGMALLAVEEGEGPLAPFIAQAGEVAAPPAAYGTNGEDQEPYERGDGGDHEAGAHEQDEREGYGDGHGEGGEEELLETLHSAFVYLTLALAALHVVGVLASSIAHGENLPKAMVTGRKRA